MEDTYKHRGMRRQLVRTLASKGIDQQLVLDAFQKVPRHFFFDAAFDVHAYEDKAFPIGHGQTISQPYTVAFQTQLLNIKPGDKILEIGTGSGYQAVVLMELGAIVHSIERVAALHQQAARFLPSLGYRPHLYLGDGSLGLPEKAPFEGILVTAGAPHIPDVLIDQLAIGGKLVIPVGDHQRQQMIRLTKKRKAETMKETFNHFSFVPLKGKEGWH